MSNTLKNQQSFQKNSSFSNGLCTLSCLNVVFNFFFFLCQSCTRVSARDSVETQVQSFTLQEESKKYHQIVNPMLQSDNTLSHQSNTKIRQLDDQVAPFHYPCQVFSQAYNPSPPTTLFVPFHHSPPARQARQAQLSLVVHLLAQLFSLVLLAGHTLLPTHQRLSRTPKGRTRSRNGGRSV